MSTSQNGIKKSKIPKKTVIAASGRDLHHLAFDKSFQANIIFLVSNGDIITANKSACTLLNYSEKEILSQSSSTIFVTNERSFKKMFNQITGKGHSAGLITAIKKSGQHIPCEITCAIFLDQDGIEKAITTITDRSKTILKQKNIDKKKEKIVAENIMLAEAISDAKQEDILLLAGKLSFDVIWNWNLVTDELSIGEGFEEMFGYPVKKKKATIGHWTNYLHPDDKEVVEKGLQEAIASSSSHWEHAYTIIRADNTTAKVFANASILRHADGKAYRAIGVIHDLSQQQELEEKLETEIKLKEKQIAEAAKEAKETERSDLGKELHDNINQLLTASKLYLEMAKQGGDNSQIFLKRSSLYTHAAIEEIRNLTKGLTTDIIKNLGLCEAIENITRDMMEVSHIKISCSLKSFKENSVREKFKLNIFRIIQEQLNNILKHSKATEASINLLQNKKFIELTISDNGVGFDTSKKRNGIGLENIKSRAMTYKGTASFVSQLQEGCVLTVTFPAIDLILQKR
jgi:PAS domain S-box-containing protein